MSRRALLARIYIAGAALFGSVLAYSAAHAQAPGCCEGGSAFGANAWTAGNNWAGWGVAAPVFDPSDTWPAEAESDAGLKDGPAPYWWTHGELEIGGRDFVNDPRVGGDIYGNTVTGTSPHQGVGYAYLGQQSLAKYYEYSIQAPGAFGGGHVAMGSSDGLYQVDLWANNVASNFAGFSDQAYTLEASKAGEHYLTVTWDQTPHIYSTDAQTPYTIGTSAIPGVSGAGARYLTLPSAIVGKPLTPSAATGGYAAGGPTGAGIIPYLHPMDLGIERDTISFAYRWTPTELGGLKDDALSQYDFNTYYSHMDRTGTQAGGIVSLWNSGNQATQIPVPIDDTTQNYGASGERIGETPWGKYTFKLGYSGSTYTDNISSYFVQNPFYPTTAQCGSKPANCVAGQMSTPPSNEMNSISGTITADLPYSTRYAGTLSYTDMTQNATFLPMTDNPLAGVSPFANTPYGPNPNWNLVNFGYINGNLNRPVTSLNGDIGTLLSNNVFTTPITPDLTSKLTYRYYNFDNQTPQIVFPTWVSFDSASGSNNAIASLSTSYVKQNVGEELNWRPDREWNFNAAYGFERYDWTEADVGATNENSGKLSGDWRPNSWFDARLTGYFADRRYEGNYSYLDNVASVQYPTVSAPYTSFGFNATNCKSPCISPDYLQFMYDNRQETKVDFVTNITVFQGVTISPSVKYQDDYYGVNPNYNLGVNDNAMVSAGVDAVYVPRPDLSFSLSYYWEKYNTLYYSDASNYPGLYSTSSGATNVNAVVTTRDNEYVNTITAAMNYAIIPNKLNFDLRAAISDGLVQQSTACLDGQTLLVLNPNTANKNYSGSTCGAYPNDTNLFEHVEANLTYKLDPALLGDTSFKDMKLRLRYTWERNAVANWQNDPLAPFTSLANPTNATTGALTNTALWMAYDNPNYNVQAVAASLIFQW